MIQVNEACVTRSMEDPGVMKWELLNHSPWCHELRAVESQHRLLLNAVSQREQFFMSLCIWRTFGSCVKVVFSLRLLSAQGCWADELQTTECFPRRFLEFSDNLCVTFWNNHIINVSIALLSSLISQWSGSIKLVLMSAFPVWAPG